MYISTLIFTNHYIRFSGWIFWKISSGDEIIMRKGVDKLPEMIIYRPNFPHLDVHIVVAWSFVLLNSENYSIKCFMYLTAALEKSLDCKKISRFKRNTRSGLFKKSQKHLPRGGTKLLSQVCTIWLCNDHMTYNRMEGFPQDFVHYILHSFAHWHYSK